VAGTEASAAPARELLKRVSVDPMQILILVACALLLGAIVWRYVL